MVDRVDPDFDLNFIMDYKKIGFGKTEGVDLFNLEVLKDCTVKGVNHIQEWYAAYISIPQSCIKKQSEIVQSLQEDGADFIFIDTPGETEVKPSILNTRVLYIPVFPLSVPADKSFISRVLDATKLPVSSAETTAPRDQNKAILKLFITFPQKMSKNNRAEVKLYYSPATITSFEYLEVLGSVYETIKDYVDFEPIIVVYKMHTNGGRSKNCYKHTEFCAADPDGEGPFNGGDVVRESLREKCVFESSKEKWFKYMKCFASDCPNDFKESCSKGCVSGQELVEKDIQSCLESREQKILVADYNKLKLLSELNYPMLTINEVTYRVRLV